MSELIGLIQTVLSNPSPSILITVACIAMIYKSKVLLSFFLEIKDLNKKRLMQKMDEHDQVCEKNYLSNTLKDDYLRLCEEQQLQAIIGCQYCSRDMAKYIMTRKNIGRAIRIYHRINDEIEIKDGIIKPITPMPKWRIRLNSIMGLCFYIGFVLIGAFPLILVGLAKLFGQKVEMSSSFYLEAFLLAIAFFIIAVFTLYQSLKPEFTALFCQLEAHDQENSAEEKEEKIQEIHKNQVA